MKAKNHPAKPRMIKRNTNPIKKTSFLRSKVPPQMSHRLPAPWPSRFQFSRMECYDFLDTGTLLYYRIGDMSNPCRGKGEQQCAEKNLKWLIRVGSKRF
jgi:hypothetical protein